MKKLLIFLGFALVAAGIFMAVSKDRQGPMNDLGEPVAVIEGYLMKNPSDAASGPLRRLLVAMKARPSAEKTVLTEFAVRSVQDASVSPQEAAMLEEAARLAEQDVITEEELKTFTAAQADVLGAESASAPAGKTMEAIDVYLRQNPAGAGAAALRRLSAAMKARPAVQETVVGQAVAHSIQDGSVSAQEEAMLNEAAALAEQGSITDLQIRQFAAKFQGESGALGAAPGLEGFSAVDHYIRKNPAGRGVRPLRRLVEAHKKRPAATQVLAASAIQSVQDGSVSPREAALLEKAAALAERNPIPESELKAFSAEQAKVSAAESTSAQAAAARTAQRIDTHLKKQPAGRGSAQLRRLSTAIKKQPAQTQVLAEAAARSLQDGQISKEEEDLLEEAVELAEREGLSPQEMAEFSSKYRLGIGLSEKPASAQVSEPASSEPLPSFEGKRRLTYTFTGTVECAQTPCTHVQVSVRASSGKWVETREGGLDPQKQYILQMPVLSAVGEKVEWHLSANSKELQKADLHGQRVTTEGDRDVSVPNNLSLKPAL
jgi:tellurite resistance protein